MKGLKRQEPRSPSARLPLTADLLATCISTLRAGYSSPSTDSTLEAMFLLAFFGFLRCSEFTSSTFDPSVHPCGSDITLPTP